jgi:hypothetical protein
MERSDLSMQQFAWKKAPGADLGAFFTEERR